MSWHRVGIFSDWTGGDTTRELRSEVWSSQVIRPRTTAITTRSKSRCYSCSWEKFLGKREAMQVAGRNTLGVSDVVKTLTIQCEAADCRALLQASSVGFTRTPCKLRDPCFAAHAALVSNTRSNQTQMCWPSRRSACPAATPPTPSSLSNAAIAAGVNRMWSMRLNTLALLEPFAASWTWPDCQHLRLGIKHDRIAWLNDS